MVLFCFDVVVVAMTAILVVALLCTDFLAPSLI